MLNITKIRHENYEVNISYICQYTTILIFHETIPCKPGLCSIEF